MAGDNDKDKMGFSGLSDLASEVSGIDEPIKPEPKAEDKPSTPKQPPQPQREIAPPEPERKTTSSPPPIEISSDRSLQGFGWKWLLGIIGVIVVIWIMSNGGQDTKKSSPSTPSPSTPSPRYNPYENQPTHSTLLQEIEYGRLKAEQMEIQIKNMDGRLEDLKREIMTYRASDMIDEYNTLVPRFNSLVAKRNGFVKKYRRLID